MNNKNKFKIGIDARMYGYAQTGIGNYIRHLLKYIFEMDQENEYVVFLLPEEYESFKLPHKRVKKVQVSAKWYSWPEQVSFPWELWKEKLDLMHFTHFNSPILYPGKTVVTIHDITPYFFPGHKMKSFARRLGFRTVFYSSVKKAAKVIAVSQSTKNDISDRFKIGRDKISVIYEGISGQFHEINEEREINGFKARYGITKPYIFYTGVWRNHKNLVGLIKAFGILRKSHRLDYQLVLGGKEDPYYPEVRETWEKLGLGDRIISAGFIKQEELPLFYSAAEVFVIPSFYEGFGLVGLEAMACKTPVVSSNKTSLPEILQDAAQYFDPENPRDMAEKISLVLGDKKLYNELVAKGLQQCKKYNWRQMAKETLEIYEDILRH